MGRIRKLPQNDGAKAWSALLPPRRTCPPLAAEIRADWVVIGAGFTGLAAARRLSELRPQDDIVIIDAGVVGEGASGRNSGFAIDHAHTLGGGEADTASMRAQKRLYTAAIRHLRDVVNEHGIDCDWREDGKFHAAASKGGVRRYLKPLANAFDAAGEPYEWFDRAAMEEALGIDAYEAGVFTPGTVLVNPAALVRGLADALPDNVTLHEETPAIEITGGEKVRVRTRGGAVDAHSAIIATNAYTPALGLYKGRLLPFLAFASLTERMTESEQLALGGRESWGLTPANAFVGPTIQRTGDQRILFRQGITYWPRLKYGKDDLADARARHAAQFKKRFPMLSTLSLEYSWGGFLSISANQRSAFGKVDENIWAAAGHQGIGVTRGTIAGALLANLALERENPLHADMATIAGPAENPPQPFLDIGVRTRMMWDGMTNFGER